MKALELMIRFIKHYEWDIDISECQESQIIDDR
jgi:hypothetical protein